MCDNGYKVALVLGLVKSGGSVDQDYHWYRQDAGGKWSHKPGGKKATDKDQSGNEITDPETADRGKVDDDTPAYKENLVLRGLAALPVAI